MHLFNDFLFLPYYLLRFLKFFIFFWNIFYIYDNHNPISHSLFLPFRKVHNIQQYGHKTMVLILKLVTTEEYSPLFNHPV